MQSSSLSSELSKVEFDCSCLILTLRLTSEPSKTMTNFFGWCANLNPVKPNQISSSSTSLTSSYRDLASTSDLKFRPSQQLLLPHVWALIYLLNLPLTFPFLSLTSGAWGWPLVTCAWPTCLHFSKIELVDRNPRSTVKTLVLLKCVREK